MSNTGQVLGDEVVLAFVKPIANSLATLPTSTPVEKKRLFDFKRITLQPFTDTVLTFSLNASHLAMVDADGHTALHEGEFEVIFSRGHGEELTTPVHLRIGSVEAPAFISRFRKWW